MFATLLAAVLLCRGGRAEQPEGPLWYVAPGVTLLPPPQERELELSPDHSPLAESLESPGFAQPLLLAPAVELANVAKDGGGKKKKPPKFWTGRVELGFNGAEGNTLHNATRFNAHVVGKADPLKLILDFRYTTASNEGERTQDNWLYESRLERRIPDSPWSSFAHGMVEYDRFTAFDIRVSGDAGLAYYIFDSDDTELQFRAGGGVSREYGVDDAEAVPEVSSGFTFEHQLTKLQKLLAKADIYPDVRKFSEFRARSEASWEIKLEQIDQIGLKLSLLDRYDSTPSGKRRNDLTYSAEVVWDF